MKFLILIFFFNQVEKTILAEGASSVEGISKGVARERAIQDALRNLVEQGTGLFISSETIIENFELLQDKIFSKAEGYIKEYSIISEKEEAGLYRVKIKAKVAEGKLKDDLEALRLLVLEKERPRVLVVSSASFLEDMLQNSFRDAGFPVLDPLSLKRKMDKEKLRAIYSGANDTALARYALREGAEMIVFSEYVEGEKEEESPYFKGKKLKEVVITARIIDPLSAEILSSERIEKTYPQITSSVKKRLVDSLFSVLKREIIENWQRGENIVKIYLYNVSFEKIGEIRNFLLLNLKRVKKIILREFIENTGIIEVITPETPSNISHILINKYSDLKLREIQGQNIYVEIKNQTKSFKEESIKK
ncbi:MAG: hypothetical protein ABDH37_05220 [Candidatus Hydrothermales bacterium]